MTQICIACGKTDVNFASQTRKTGVVYQYIRCISCQWKRRIRVQNGTAKPIDKPNMPRFRRNSRFRVLKCLHNEYEKGSSFLVGDFKETLRGGNWPLGMIVGIEDKKYAVCGNGVFVRTLKGLGYPLGIRMPTQWLAEVA